MALSAPTRCPCDTGLDYRRCCGRYHAGELHGAAPDAVALMRSRYSAYVLGHADYLLSTWQPDHRPDVAGLILEPRQWLGLEVRGHELTDRTHAVVEFVARSRIGGRGVRLHEVSRFVLENERWFYVDGDLIGH